MKRTLLLAFVSLTPLHAFGDYVPGRVRATAEAALRAVRGDGIYQGIRSAKSVEFATDGRGVTSFRLALGARAETDFAVRSIEQNRCGRSFLAEAPGSKLRVDETSPAACREEGPVTWRVTLVTTRDDGEPSRLELTGLPEFYVLTE